jgi:membrane protease YdiL (CAAX protease family)
MLAANLWEEIGWRGFVLPRLQKRFSPLGSSLILGFFWSLWHLPLLLNPTEEMSVIPIWAELPYSLALSVLYTWLYNKANGNLAVVTLAHAMINTVALLMMLEHPNTPRHVLINIAVTIVFAAIVAVLQMSPKSNMKKITE